MIYLYFFVLRFLIIFPFLVFKPAFILNCVIISNANAINNAVTNANSFHKLPSPFWKVHICGNDNEQGTVGSIVFGMATWLTIVCIELVISY